MQTLQASGQRFENTLGTLYAGQLSVQVDHLSISGGMLMASNANLNSTEASLAQGAQLYTQALSLTTQSLNNAGDIQSASTAQISVAELFNNTGRVTVAEDFTVMVATLNNSDGQLLAGNDLSITAQAAINNSHGILNAQGALTLHDSVVVPSQRNLVIINSSGQIVANNTSQSANSAVNITAHTLGLDGTLHSGGDMVLDLVGDLNTSYGQQVRAGRDLNVQLVDGQFSNAGQWQAGQTSACVLITLTTRLAVNC